MGTYLRDVGRHSLISREAEHEIAVQYRATADPQLAARLVTANLRLVVKVAKQFRRANTSLADLVQEGNVGLVQAVSKYDPSRGVRFSSYAVWSIRAYILQFLMSNHRLVKVGTTQAQRKLFFNIRKQREKLERQGAEVDSRQLAASLDVSEREVVDMERRLDATETSLDAPARGESMQLRRDVTAGPESRPDVRVETGEFNAVLGEKLRAFAATLSARDLAIFRDRLFNDEPARLTELADRFGLSRERVRQLELTVKQRLRAYLMKELGDATQIDMVH